MSRDRFSLLLRFLHLNDSTKYIPKGEPGYDPPYKLRPLVDPFIANFKAAFNLGHEIAVDEGMIGFKGRLWFLQYMPKKPNQVGDEGLCTIRQHYRIYLQLETVYR